MQARPLQARGFTLIEIMLVLLISVLAVSLVSPKISNVIDSTKLKAASRELLAALRVSRDKAIIKQEETVLTLNVERRQYESAETKRQLQLPKGTTLKLTTAKSERTTAEQGRIRFFPDGSSTGGQIALEHAKQNFVIDVNWLTGKIKILP